MVLFWQALKIEQFSAEQWESLCDGCGKCCLHKLQDEDDDTVYYTDVACRYLGRDSARCGDYANRLSNVPECLNLTPATLAETYWWLPPTCAYRRLAEGKDLPVWHPLLTGDARSVAAAGQSVSGRVVSEQSVPEDLWQERVVHWVTENSENSL